MYVVDLGGQQVVVREELLAQRIDAGATVDYYPDQGDREEVEVEEVFGSRWPPVYLVKRQRGGLAEAADDRLVADRLPSAAPAVFPRPAAHSLPEPPTVPFVPERQESEAAGGVSGAYGETRPPPTGPAVCPVPSAEDLAAMSEPTEDEIAAFKPDPSLPAALGGVPPPPPSPIVTSILAGKAEALAPAPAPEEPPAAPVAPPSPPAMPPSPPPVKAPSPPLPPPPAPAPAPTYAVAALPMVAPAPAFTPAPAPALVPPASIPQPTPGFEPSLAAATEAQKHAKQAASALSFDDIPTAIANLTSALRLLTGSKT